MFEDCAWWMDESGHLAKGTLMLYNATRVIEQISLVEHPLRTGSHSLLVVQWTSKSSSIIEMGHRNGYSIRSPPWCPYTFTGVYDAERYELRCVDYAATADECLEMILTTYGGSVKNSARITNSSGVIERFMLEFVAKSDRYEPEGKRNCHGFCSDLFEEIVDGADWVA